MSILHIITYICLLAFIYMILAKIIKVSKSPLHLRWELYPVPHEKGRSHYGGSRLEEVDWWTKSPEKGMIGELKVMIPEIILLKGVWEHNKSLWLGSFPFHFALYIFSVNIFLLIISSFFFISGNPISANANGISLLLYWLLIVLIWFGSIMGLTGSLRLLLHRIVDNGLRKYSSVSHFFNIILIGAIFLTSLLWIILDNDMISHLSNYYTGLISFSTIIDLPLIGYIHIYTSLFFIIYLPLTHMTHFFMKYFTYHKVRWEDEPNYNNPKMKEKIAVLLGQTVTWSAPHIGADGRKNWIAIASEMPPSNKEKK